MMRSISPVRLLPLLAIVVALTGCASTRGGAGAEPALPEVTVDEFIAMQPQDRKREIAQAERDLRMAERRAARAVILIPLAETQLRIARADANARQADVKRADANLALVHRQHRAVFAGAPADSRTVPEDVQQALRRTEEAEHAVDVARWAQEGADALVRLREEELAYAQGFRDAAERDVDMQRAEVDLAKIGLVARSTARILPGVTDPRMAVAQSRVRDAQAGYARAHADATTRLSAAQMHRAGMASYREGPPAMLSLSGAAGQSGAAGLAPAPVVIEAEPLPWPDAWEDPAEGRPNS